jgi:hypothetical protein
MKYDTSKTAQMRDMFGLKTIPALMILKNDDFEKDEPFVISNAREILELDKDLKMFPWGTTERKQAAPVTAFERLWIHGRHGNWWQLGHTNVSELHPTEMYMDEHAVRMRAGLLNVITWVAIMNVFHMKNPKSSERHLWNCFLGVPHEHVFGTHSTFSTGGYCHAHVHCPATCSSLEASETQEICLGHWSFSGYHMFYSCPVQKGSWKRLQAFGGCRCAHV